MARPSYLSVGTVSYNGYPFKEPLSSRAIVHPIRDASDRTTKYVRITLEIETYIFPDDDSTVYGSTTTGAAASTGATTDNALQELRAKLTATGKALTFTGMGFGTDIEINVSRNGRLDVAFGPKPRILAWTPIGSDKAAKVLWVCETTIPECEDHFPYHSLQATDFSCEIAWSINHEGLTVRKVSGSLEIAMTRDLAASPGQINDTADNYRHFITEAWPALPGFFRDMDFVLSSDRRTISFTLTDTEINSDNIFPNNLVNIDVDHTVSSADVAGGGSTQILNGITWTNTLSGTITVAPGVPKTLAWEVFRTLINGRTGIINFPVDNSQYANTQKSQWCTGLTITNSLYNRRIRFEASFALYSTLSFFLGHSGVFKRVSGQGDSWNIWKASMDALSITHPNGPAQLQHFPSQDVLLDLCERPSPVPDPSYPVNHIAYEAGLLFEQIPTPENSWAGWDNTFSLYFPNTGSVVVKRYPAAQTDPGWTQDQPPQQGSDGSTDNSLSSKVPILNNAVDAIVQIFNIPAAYVIMRGHAIRRYYAPFAPRLASFGGVTAYRVYQNYKSRVLAQGAIPLYRLDWYIVYILAGYPDLSIASVIEGGDTDGKPTDKKSPAPK